MDHQPSTINISFVFYKGDVETDVLTEKKSNYLKEEPGRSYKSVCSSRAHEIFFPMQFQSKILQIHPTGNTRYFKNQKLESYSTIEARNSHNSLTMSYRRYGLNISRRLGVYITTLQTLNK